MSTQQQQSKLQAGDSLVNDNGSVVVDIQSVESDRIKVEDSRRAIDDGWYDRSEIETFASADEITLVRDSQLTAIKGVGAATAPKLQAATGCETPSELAEAYLHAEASVRDHIPRTDYFNEWLRANVDSLDVAVSAEQVAVFLFIQEMGVETQHASLIDDAPINHRYNKVDTDEFAVSHIEWDEGNYWADSANVAAIGHGPWKPNLRSLEWGQYVPNVANERDGGHHLFCANGNETWISGDYLDDLRSIVSFDLSDVMVHPDGEFPVYVECTDVDLSVMIAPRIKP
jgi:predicted flap endonuclease-1-like 5' DNA nuclease